MSFHFRERPKSRSGTANPPTENYVYVAYGTTDSQFVHAYALGATPAFVSTIYGTLYRQDIKVDAEASDHWQVTVPYAQNKQETGQYRLSFDTTGGTVNIKASLATIERFPRAGDTAIDYKGLIGVHGEDVDGADIVIPALKLTVNYKHPFGVITLPQIKNLARLTGKTNSGPFLTFDAREILFLGATGSEGTDTETEVTYQFACSENATGITIGEIMDIAKAGHDVAWVEWEPYPDGGKAARRPKCVHVERVYQEVDLASVLGFG